MEFHCSAQGLDHQTLNTFPPSTTSPPPSHPKEITRHRLTNHSPSPPRPLTFTYTLPSPPFTLKGLLGYPQPHPTHRLYLGKASAGSAYGAAGSLIVVIVWVYYSSQIFFFGAEFTHQLAQRQSPPSPS